MNIQTINQNQNLSFQMRIRFAYKDAFADLPKSVISDFPYSAKTAARSSKAVSTEHCADCNIIGITNGKKTVLYHLIPQTSNLGHFNDFTKPAEVNKRLSISIQKSIDKLRKDGEKVRAFILGGQSVENSETRSLSLFEGLNKILKKNDIKPTVIWGQESALDAHYSVKEDTLTIFLNMCQISAKGIKKYFKLLDFRPEDTAYLPNGKEINTNYLRQNKKAYTRIKDTKKER